MQSSTADMDRRKRFDQIVGVFHQDMYRYAAWLCRDKAIAEDVVQESMLRAWKSLDALRDDSAAKPWLLTIVRRENARYFERKRLETVTVVRPGEVADRERIFFGAWVTLEDESGEEHRYRLVGPDEIDVSRGLISVESPMGRVLLGKREDDEVTVERPAGPAVYVVSEISYEVEDA